LVLRMLLRASFSVPRVHHLLRCSPSVDHEALTTYDDLLRSALSHSDFTDTVVAGKPADQRWWPEDRRVALRFQLFWRLLRVPSSLARYACSTDSFFETFCRTLSETFGTSPSHPLLPRPLSCKRVYLRQAGHSARLSMVLRTSSVLRTMLNCAEMPGL